MAIASGSITNAKSKGESGQPCLVPRFKGKIEEDTPLARTEHTGEEYKSFIQDMNVLPKPNFCSTQKKVIPFHPIKGFLCVKQ